MTLSVEGGADANGVLPTGIGTVSVSPSTITLNKGTSQTATRVGQRRHARAGRLLAVAAGDRHRTRAANRSPGWSRSASRSRPRSTSNEYVDILGFTTFRITSIDSNAVYGYAISGVYADMNDPALRRGQVARLVPWS